MVIRAGKRARRDALIRKSFVSSTNRSFDFLSVLLVYSFSLFAATDTPSVFAVAERFFGDSLYLSALENYRAYINAQHTPYKRSPENGAAAFFKIGLCFYRTANFAAAAAAFEEYLRLFPGDKRFTDALLYCGNAYKATGDFKSASEQLYQAWVRGASPSKRQAPLFESALCAERDGNDDRAAAIYGEYLKKYPADGNAKDAAFSLATILIKQKKYAFASDALAMAEKQWSKDEPFFTRLLYAKAQLAKAQQKNENALRLFSAVMSRGDDFPEKERAVIDYASMLEEQRQYKALLPVYKKLSEIYKKKGGRLDGDFLFKWAQCAVNAGNFEQGEKLLRQLLAEYPGDARAGQAAYTVAECLLGKNEAPKALETLQEIVSGNFSQEWRAKAALAIGDSYYGQGLYQNAIAAYRLYCSMPGTTGGDSIQFKIARTYQEKGLLALAIKEYEQCMRQYPQSPYYYPAAFNAGRCEEALSHFQDAMDRYDCITESDAPADWVATAKKRKDYLRMFKAPRLEAAVGALGRLVLKDPDSLPAYHRLLNVTAVFETMLNDLPAALDLYEQVARCSPSPPDSVLVRVAFCIATVLGKMYNKAAFERDSGQAAVLKSKTLAGYQEVARASRYPLLADDAQFHIMTLGSPSIADYERYCVRYPASRHLCEALFTIGGFYEKKTAEADGESSRKAIDAYSRIIRSGPNDYGARALLALARTYSLVDRVDSAAASIDELLRRFPDSPCVTEGNYIAALIEKKRNNYPAAIERFKKLIAAYPFGEFTEVARYEMAAAQFDAGNAIDALRDFRAYAQNYPGGNRVVQARFGIARCFARTGKGEDAVRMLNELLKEPCPSALAGGIYFELARCFKSKGDVHAALDYLHKAFAADSFPEKGAVCLSMGALYFENGLYTLATKTFNLCMQYVISEADSVDALIGNINSLIMDGQEKAAEKTKAFFMKRFPARSDKFAEVEYNEGLRFLIEKQYENAINRFREVMDFPGTSNKSDDAAYHLGVCYYYMGKNEKALEWFHDFIAQYPASSFVSPAYFKIGMMLHDRGDFLHAAEVFEKAAVASTADEKSRFRAAFNAAIDYQKSSTWLEAARLYRTIVDSFPEEVGASSIYLKIGFCYIQASHFEDALKYFQKASAIAAAEEKPEVFYWMAQCWARLGDHQKAIAEYLAAAALSADGPWAITSEFEAARLYERTGEYKKALGLFKKIIFTDGEKGVFGKEAAAQCARINLLVKEN